MNWQNIKNSKPGTYIVGRDKHHKETNVLCCSDGRLLNVENGEPVAGIIEYVTPSESHRRSKLQESLPIFKDSKEANPELDHTLGQKEHRISE